MKTCSKCCAAKPATREFFGPLKKARDGLHSWCKQCAAEWRRGDRAADKERYSAIEKKRHAKSGEERREAMRRWWASAEEYKQVAKVRRKGRRPKDNESRRRKFSANVALRADRAAANARWRAENAESISLRRREAWQKATTPQRLRSYFGAAISHALKRSAKGGRSWQELVDYSVNDLIAHLERQFLTGMSWDNYGDWHVDHIVPASSFQYETPEDADFKSCWALTNLRPMWAKENISKGAKRLHLI